MASLNTKIMAGVGAVFLGSLVIGTTGMVTQHQLGGALERSARSSELMRVHMHADMMHDALRADVLAALASRDPSNGASLDEAAKDLKTHLADFKADLAKGKTLVENPQSRAALEALEAPLQAYGEAAQHIVDTVATNPAAAGAEAPQFKQQFDVLAVAMEKASEQIDGVAKADVAAARRHEATGRLLSLLMLGLGIAMSLGLALTARRQITRPLMDVVGALTRLTAGDLSVTPPHAARDDEIGQISKALTAYRDAVVARETELEAADQREAMEAERRRSEAERIRAHEVQTRMVASLAEGLGRLAQGDLTVRIDQAFDESYEALRRDFNGAMEALNEAVAGILASSASIGAGSGEISHAADNLSQRTEHQAASLEETAATLDELTTTVKTTAQGAAKAKGFVATAGEEADSGARVVESAVDAMGRIQQSATKIGQIIGVIDEIAFQTNLLALNAGVEAARAGDAGRGFAVVASEVRALAQRSADAAKEIKTLIDASSEEVAEGVDLVGRTGEALHRLAAQMHQINGFVTEIAGSAQEQATGLAEVNAAVNQMDQVTQQNAAMVEETTAAGHALAREARQLGELMSRFKVAGAAPARRPAAAAPAARAAGGGPARQLQAALARESW
jgi:methyl-accepting chemotaxis protein